MKPPMQKMLCFHPKLNHCKYFESKKKNQTPYLHVKQQNFTEFPYINVTT